MDESVGNSCRISVSTSPL